MKNWLQHKLNPLHVLCRMNQFFLWFYLKYGAVYELIFNEVCEEEIHKVLVTQQRKCFKNLKKITTKATLDGESK